MICSKKQQMRYIYIENFKINFKRICEINKETTLTITMNNSTFRSLKIENSFESFIADLTSKSLNSTPNEAADASKTFTQSLELNNADQQNLDTPQTPFMANHQVCLPLPSYRLAHQPTFKETSICETRQLSIIDIDHSDEVTCLSSPKTPKCLVQVLEPLPGYRLRRLRHHFDAHR